jgi:hypothetical protein
MKGMLLITLVLSLVPLSGDTSDLEIRTVAGAVLCTTPFQLRKSIVAAHRDEAARVRQLGCTVTGDGVKAIVTDRSAPFAGPWQVRLMPEGAPAVTMWGYASSFKSKTGEPLSLNYDATFRIAPKTTELSHLRELTK